MGVATRGIRIICDLVGDDTRSGGRIDEGREEGGWFSASED